MSAEIISLADVRVRRGSPAKSAVADSTELETPTRFHFWTGATGKRYVHTVYSLFDCPPVGIANYVLVRREGRAKRTVLAIGRVSGEAGSLNLAEIRQRGAQLSADEVHIHLLAADAQESQAVEVDLRTAQFAAMAN